MIQRNPSHMPRPSSPSPRRRKRGFTIAEVALALIVFAMMTILFAAVIPMTMRGAQYSGNYSQAALLTQHKMDQIHSAGHSRLSQTSLAGNNIIDQNQPQGFPVNTGTGTMYSFTTADALINDGVTTKGYFPPGSQGTVTVSDWTALHPAAGVPANSMAYVTVTVSWTGGGVHDGSYTTSAVIAN